MPKIATLLVALTLGPGALAAPFVYPAAWSASPAAEARNGGSYRNVTTTDFKSINPFNVVEAFNLPTLLAAGGFFRRDPARREYVPYMAESYTVSRDGLTWTMNVRPGMKWSDGRAIVADDWVTTARIHKDNAFATLIHQDFFQNGKPINVTKVDDDTVRITFASRAADAFRLASYPPWPSHVFGPVYAARGADGIKAMWALGERPENVVSSGPFRFAAYRVGERASLAKNPYFGEWNKDSAGRALPYLDAHEIAIYNSAAPALTAFLGGDLDTFTPLTGDQLAQIRRAVDGGSLRAVLKPNVGATVSTTWLTFNWNKRSDPVKQALFRSADFRRAMSHLANRAAMVELALGGLGRPIYSGVPALFRDWQSPTLRRYEFNPEAATQLLAKLGYTRKNAEGFLVNRENRVLEFELTSVAGLPNFDRPAQIFVDEARKVGVRVNYRPTDFNSLVAVITAAGDDRRFDAVILGASLPLEDYPLIATIETCDGGVHLFNRSGRCLQPWETQVQTLFARGAQELDLARRREIVRQIQDIQSREQAFIYLIAPNAHFAWNARLRGEYPQDVADPYVGPREVVLTWVAQ